MPQWRSKVGGKKKKGNRTKKKKKSIGKKNPCTECIPAKCCMYFSIEIDEPENKKDYDDLLWIIAHRDAEIYVNDDRWYLMVQTPCRFYDPIKGCLIYPKRPRICRAHSTGECEFEDDYDFELHFHSYEELERYIRNNEL
jgi:Fe-S-cluster containining protein